VSFAITEDVKGEARGATGTEVYAIATILIDNDILYFLPERRTAGLVFVQREDHTHRACRSARDCASDLHQAWYWDGFLRVNGAHQNRQAEQRRQEAL
jgi:hypothetical protein